MIGSTPTAEIPPDRTALRLVAKIAWHESFDLCGPPGGGRRLKCLPCPSALLHRILHPALDLRVARIMPCGQHRAGMVRTGQAEGRFCLFQLRIMEFDHLCVP